MMLEALREEVWKCNLELPKNDLVKMTSPSPAPWLRPR
jgi:hypothetical protein